MRARGKKNNERDQAGKIVKLAVNVESAKKQKTAETPNPDRLENNQKKFRPAAEIIRDAKLKHAHKQFVMWSGVTFFMLIIAGAWFINIRSVFSEISAEVSVEDGGDFDEAKDIARNFGEQVNELKKIFEEASVASSSEPEFSVENGNETIDVESFNTLPELGDPAKENVDVKGISLEDVEIIKEKLNELKRKK